MDCLPSNGRQRMKKGAAVGCSFVSSGPPPLSGSFVHLQKVQGRVIVYTHESRGSRPLVCFCAVGGGVRSCITVYTHCTHIDEIMCAFGLGEVVSDSVVVGSEAS